MAPDPPLINQAAQIGAHFPLLAWPIPVQRWMGQVHVLLAAGGQQLGGTVGDACDNPLAESAIGLFKAEVIKPAGPVLRRRG